MHATTPAPSRPRTVVGALALSEIVSWGILYYAFGALVPPMQAELGWSQGLLGGAFSLALFVSALLAVPVGRWLERHGPRGLMTVGSCAGALLVYAWSVVEHPLALYALFAALGFPLASVLYEAAFAALIGFLGSGRRTDLALLLLTVVAGFASTVFVPLTQWLAEEHGWRGALRILAALLALTTIPLHALVLRGVTGSSRAPRGRSPGPDPLADPAGRPLVACAAGFALATTAGTSLGVYLVPILAEQGFSAAFVAAAASLLGLGQAVGRLSFTALRPRYSLALWSVLLFLPPAASLVALALRPSGALALACVFLFSVACGSHTLARTAWALALFPTASFARVNGVLGLWSLLGRAGAPLAIGALHDASGSHRPGLLALALALAAGGGSAWLAARSRGSRANGTGSRS